MSEIRRRRGVPAAETDGSRAQKALDSLRTFDVYTKVHDDYVQKSQAGGAVTVVTSLILALLFWFELLEFCAVEVKDSISVDTRINQKLPISLDMTFEHLRCDEVSVDTVDAVGDNQVDVQGELAKHPLDVSGRVVSTLFEAKPDDCFSCLDAAEAGEHRCCNSCLALKRAYVEKFLPYTHVLSTAEQCRDAIGCHVSGAVTVDKISGNVHVALGKATVREGKHMHDFNMKDFADGFNTSHRINKISFGDSIPGQRSPLEGTAKTVKWGAFMFHYYVKLVPTVYQDRYGTEVYTNQYSVTETNRNVQISGERLTGLPGVFIVYDFSPFVMRKTETVKPWSYMFTSICAIVGGVFSIASLVEMLVNGVVRHPLRHEDWG